MEYIKSNNLCLIRKDRLQEALDLGLIAVVEGDYMLTYKAVRNFRNAFSWINGNEAWNGNEFVDELIPIEREWDN